MQKHILRAALLLSLTLVFAKPLLASNVTLIMPGQNDTAAPAQLSPDKYPPQPALFKFQKGNSTVYLFGTAHRIVEGVKWRTNEFNRAIGKADRIWFEATYREMANPVLQIDEYMSYKNENGIRIEDILSREEMTKLNKVAQSQGMDVDEYGNLHPWAISDILDGAHYRTEVKKDAKNEIISVDGVERTIMAMSIGKPILPVENTHKHVMLFSQLTPEDEKAMLMDTINQIDHSRKEEVTAVMDAWSKGDLNAIYKLDDRMRRDTPGLYRILMTERNKIMFDKIVKILNGSGTDFVAVGAAHIAGPNGLVTMLEQAGYKAERIYDTEPPVTSDSERRLFRPHYRAEMRIPGHVDVSIIKGKTPDQVLLHLERGLVITGCAEVSPIKTEMVKNDDTIDITVYGYLVNIHPYPNIEGCGPPTKFVSADIPLSITELKKHKTFIVKMQTSVAYDYYTLSYEKGTLTLAPKTKKGEINKTFRPDMKKLVLNGL